MQRFNVDLERLNAFINRHSSIILPTSAVQRQESHVLPHADLRVLIELRRLMREVPAVE